MILVVSTCKYLLSEEEFVRPVVEIVKSYGFDCDVKRYYERINPEDYSKVIICGTALRDSDYLNYIDNFKKLIDYDGSILGICTGYQILAKLYSNTLDEIKKIGVYNVKVVKKNPLIQNDFKAYFLHKFALRNVNKMIEPLAMQGDEICMFKVKDKNFYGVSFYPEVLNREIIVNFIQL